MPGQLPGGSSTKTSHSTGGAPASCGETGITGIPLERLGALGSPAPTRGAHREHLFSFVVADARPVAADDAADAASEFIASFAPCVLGQSPAGGARDEAAFNSSR